MNTTAKGMSNAQKQKQPAGPKIDPHCRVCGYTPRKPRPGQPDFSWEKIVDHMETKHPDDVLPTNDEFLILERQGKRQ